MTARTLSRVAMALAAVAIVLQAPLFAHHSFAMYDQNKTVTVTGVVKQYVPQANHAEFHLYLLTDDRKGLEKKDGKYVEYGVEMAGTAQLERQGVTAQTYPVGTVLSVKVNPQRDGTNFGARVSALARCPMDPATNKPKLPEAGKGCDSVPGRILSGGETF
ncbi:MAG TPA: DUF6152 family protein [Vicinamibacterales bacterium]|nr:DUF6152 family protein [Vicinamibacterales bacterium]